MSTRFLAAAAFFASVMLVEPMARANVAGADKERVAVEDVMVTPDGQYMVILRTHAEPLRLLPIWIGQNEAMAIRMRLDRTKPPRPLTLNLLESVLASSNIKLMEIQIDAIKGGIFLGKVRLRQDGRVWELDARPSDAIGLALGRDAPIWVSRQVMNDAGIDASQLHSDVQQQPPTPPGTVDLEETL